MNEGLGRVGTMFGGLFDHEFAILVRLLLIEWTKNVFPNVLKVDQNRLLTHSHNFRI